jgi:hypothetical protein
MDGAPEARMETAGECLEERDDQGWNDHDPDCEGDDVHTRRAANGEELGLAPEQVEERLGDGEGPERGEMESRGQSAPALRCHRNLLSGL